MKNEIAVDSKIPICRDCHWCRPKKMSYIFGFSIFTTCMYDDAMCIYSDNLELDLVTGEHIPQLSCSSARYSGSHCGREGRWFKQKCK